MMQKHYFKVIIWFLASTFFYMAAALIIAIYSPNPPMQQSTLFMIGMMQAMDNSLMGLSMTLEHDFLLKTLIGIASQMTIPLLILGILFGIIFRFRGGKNSTEKKAPLP